MIDYLLSIFASSLAMIAYIVYFLTVKKSGIIPNRLAWLICSISVSLETITYCYISNNNIRSLYFIVASLCTIVITIKIWKLARWENSSRIQKNSLIFYSFAIAIWPLFELPFIAHLILLIAIPVTFFPIYKSAYKNYKTENILPWLLWSISDVFIIISIFVNMKTFRELPYALVSFICPFTVFAIIIFQRIRHFEGSQFPLFFIEKWMSLERKYNSFTNTIAKFSAFNFL